MAPKVKMREMWRCLVCGRGAWPTMIGQGQLGGHRMETLFFVKGLGRGKGIKWKKKDHTADAEYIKAWIQILEHILAFLDSRLEALGESDRDEDRRIAEDLQPIVLETAEELERARELIQLPLQPTTLRSARHLDRTREIVVPKILGA